MYKEFHIEGVTDQGEDGEVVEPQSSLKEAIQAAKEYVAQEGDGCEVVIRGKGGEILEIIKGF